MTISLHFYGAHDMQGFLAVVVGYPGLLANGHYTRLNETLFTVVNWLFYFFLFEGAVALKRKFLKGGCRAARKACTSVVGVTSRRHVPPEGFCVARVAGSG